MLISSLDSVWVDAVFALLAGSLLGVFYFAGLWWTVRQLSSSQHIGLLLLCSLLFRTGVVIVGFYLILGDHWQHLLLGLLGFMVIRVLATHYFRLTDPSRTIKQKPGYAP